MYVKLNGEMGHLWRPVDHEGEVHENYVTRKRDKSVALRFLKGFETARPSRKDRD
jgi:putative transposase